MLFQDECHLSHGDAAGYVWAKKGMRVQVPMMNFRHSTTFYGALDLQTQEFHLKEYQWANMENTVDYLNYLIAQYKDAKQIILIWDGASYHTGCLIKEFLKSINDGLVMTNWKLKCLLFAPNAPDQNPTEDCWLKAKNYVRKHFSENANFQQTVCCFKRAFNELTFNFGKLNWYF